MPKWAAGDLLEPGRFALGFTLGCGPGSIGDDSTESAATSDATSSGTTNPGTTDPGTTDPGTTGPGTTDSGTTNGWSTDDATDTDEPPVPLTTCTASIFTIDDTPQFESRSWTFAPVAVRDDGSIVAVHVVGDEYFPDYRIRAWNDDGTPIWDQPFLGTQEQIVHPNLARDELGDLYLGHGSIYAEMASLTKLPGADSTPRRAAYSRAETMATGILALSCSPGILQRRRPRGLPNTSPMMGLPWSSISS